MALFGMIRNKILWTYSERFSRALRGGKKRGRPVGVGGEEGMTIGYHIYGVCSRCEIYVLVRYGVMECVMFLM